MNKRILVCGPWRSGTTALYNLTRTICFQHGTVYGCFEDQYESGIAKHYDFQVVKVHKYKEEWVEWADVIITVFREPDEIWESMQRFTAVKGHDSNGKREFSISDVWRGLSWLVFFNIHTNYFITFNQIERCPEKLADQIAQRIGLKIEPKEIVKEFLQIVPPKKGYDPVTLLHSNHVTR